MAWSVEWGSCEGPVRPWSWSPTPRGHHQDSAPPSPSSPQIKDESFLEDINNVLNSGDIPNLYNTDEQDQIVNTMRPYVQEQGLQPMKTNLMAAYTERVRSSIHLVLCMRYRWPLQPCRDSGFRWGSTWACHKGKWPGPGHHAIGSRLPCHRAVK